MRDDGEFVGVNSDLNGSEGEMEGNSTGGKGVIGKDFRRSEKARQKPG